MDVARAERAREAAPPGADLSLYEKVKRLRAERARRKGKKEKKDHGR